MALFAYSSQQWFNTDCIEHVDDFGWDIEVTLKSGKTCRVSGSDRDRFFRLVKPARDPSELGPHAEMEMIRSILAGRKPDGLYGNDAG